MAWAWVDEIVVWLPVSRAVRSCSDMPDGSGALMSCRNVLLSVVELSGFQPGAPPPVHSARGQALDRVLSVTVRLSRPVG